MVATGGGGRRAASPPKVPMKGDSRMSPMKVTVKKVSVGKAPATRSAVKTRTTTKTYSNPRAQARSSAQPRSHPYGPPTGGKRASGQRPPVKAKLTGTKTLGPANASYYNPKAHPKSSRPKTMVPLSKRGK